MFKKLSYSQFNLFMLLIIAIIFITGFKCIHIMTIKMDVFSAAHALIREQSKTENNWKVNDGEIIVSKIFPKNTFRYAINPIVWTKKQMSENDELLQACIDAQERESNKEAVKYKEDISTFEARFSTWEVNEEKAKESL